MKKIVVNTQALSHQEYKIAQCFDEVSGIKNRFHAIKNNLDSDIICNTNINSFIIKISRDLEDIQGRLNQLASTTNNIVNTYELQENKIESLMQKLDDPIFMKSSNNKGRITSDGQEKPLPMDMFPKMSINHISDFLKINYIKLSYPISNEMDFRSTEAIKFTIDRGMILEESILKGLGSEIAEKDIIEFKKRLEKLLAQISGFEVILNKNGNYNGVMDDALDEAVYRFMYWLEGKYSGNNFIFTYEAMPTEYKLKTLLHWAKLADEDYDTLSFMIHILPEEYYHSIPPVPALDAELGQITSENKYISSDAYEYYVKYLYPSDALNEINHWNFPEEARRTNFNVWARMTYGSNKAEQKEEFGAGIFLGLSITPIKVAYDMLEGIYLVIKDPAIIGQVFSLVGKAVFSSEYRKVLVMMIEQSITEWRIAYDQADPGDKGVMIGRLIGDVLASAIELAEGGIGLVKFVKSGGFRKALRATLKVTEFVKNIALASVDEIGQYIKKIKKLNNYYEVVTPDGVIVKIRLEDLNDSTIKRLDGLVTGIDNKIEFLPKHTKDIMKSFESYMDNPKFLKKIEELDLKNNIKELITKHYTDLSPEEYKKIIELRRSIPNPDNKTLMQKIIKFDDLKYYIGADNPTIGGCVAKASDVKHLDTYSEIRDGLRLDYKVKDKYPFPENGNEVYAIRFKTDDIKNVEIPDVDYIKNKGWEVEYPQTGTGFTAAKDGSLIPEYNAANYMKPQDGSEIYKIIDGKEELYAVYDSELKTFILCEY